MIPNTNSESDDQLEDYDPQEISLMANVLAPDAPVKESDDTSFERQEPVKTFEQT